MTEDAEAFHRSGMSTAKTDQIGEGTQQQPIGVFIQMNLHDEIPRGAQEGRREK